ncbi:MAG: hypothetical protein Q7K43_03115, partial [Candidatus Woesearchaeota archaeon]|nr:hypothetical protein [Candidatus Woesearchaeota archaeon]
RSVVSFFDSNFPGIYFDIEQEKQIRLRKIMKLSVMNCRANRCQGTGNYPLAVIKTLDERVNKETYLHGTKVRVLHNLVKSSEKGKRYDLWANNTHVALEVELKPVYD